MKIAIVEDVRADSDLLESLLEQYAQRENIKVNIKVYPSGEEFMAEWPTSPDMVFLDIQMAGVNGIDVAKKIRKTNEHTVIIFITNNPQYSLSGYSVDALDYLIKPPTSDMLEQLIPHAIRRLGMMDRSRLAIRNMDGLHMINLCDVNYIELKNRRVNIHTQTNNVSSMGSLNSLEEQLPRTFFRCHSAFIVNLSAVECLKGQDVIVAGTAIPISKHRRKEFVNALTDCMGDAL